MRFQSVNVQGTIQATNFLLEESQNILNSIKALNTTNRYAVYTYFYAKQTVTIGKVICHNCQEFDLQIAAIGNIRYLLEVAITTKFIKANQQIRIEKFLNSAADPKKQISWTGWTNGIRGEEMAKKVGMLDEYQRFYSTFSEINHVSSRKMLSQIIIDEGSVTVSSLPITDTRNLIVSCLITCIEILINELIDAFEFRTSKKGIQDFYKVLEACKKRSLYHQVSQK